MSDINVFRSAGSSVGVSKIHGAFVVSADVAQFLGVQVKTFNDIANIGCHPCGFGHSNIFSFSQRKHNVWCLLGNPCNNVLVDRNIKSE